MRLRPMDTQTPHAGVGALAMALVATLFISFLGAITAAPAQAEEPPPPQTVASDVLPTPQVNGVVWAVEVNGNTAYAVGSFTRARPYGVAAGGAGELVRNNGMAFDIVSGQILAWNPNFNAQVRDIEFAPDRTQLFVGGDFTTVGGVARSKVAGFAAANGSLVAGFATSIGGQVATISVTSQDVFVGGSFGTVAGQTRSNVAKLARSSGALQAWSPVTDDQVHGLIAVDGSDRVLIGGRFQNLNGQPKVGIGAVDKTTAASLPWSSTPVPARQGSNRSWVVQLILVDGVVYAADNGDGGHWFDGRWAADFETGDLIWLDNCYGSTSGVSVMGDILYSVNHAHDCSSLGGFPEENPSIWKRSLATTIYPTGTDQAPPSVNSTYSGQPIPQLLHWYPSINTGFYTGQYQGGWALDNNGRYLVMGGEFTRINGKDQQGLAVYATRDTAPNKMRPEYTAALKPSAISLSAGTVRLAWPSTWDIDDEKLKYEVLRDNSLTAVATIEESSIWWRQKALGFRDEGRTPGATHTYRIRVSDPWGNEYIGPRSDPVVVSNVAAGGYGDVIRAAGPTAYYPLDEASGTVAFDHAAFNDADASGALERGREGAIAGNAASGFNGASLSTRTSATAPNTFSTQLWFKTSTTQGGKLVGYGNARTGASGSYDRHVWMDDAGRLHFGTWVGSAATVSSNESYNDGEWHQMTATLGPSGMALYVDGLPVAQRADITSGQAYSGYWRIGADNMNGWPNRPTSLSFAGDIDEAAIYPTVLDRDTVLAHYTASGRTADIPEPPADAYGLAVYEDDPLLYWRLDETEGGIAKDTTVQKNDANIAGSVNKGVAGVLDGGGAAMGFGATDAAVVARNAVTDPRVFSLESWFNTTTGSGGKIIGFGNAASGLSNNYDRHVTMGDDGRLTFGVYTGAMNVATSPAAYNDGKWHHVVATLSGDGMRLYVDGVLRGTNPQTAAQAYTGYWRVGGDRTWNSSSPWFNGAIDEAAVYPVALTGEQVESHYALVGGANTAPESVFTALTDGLSVSVDGTESTDADGAIVDYTWDFGDGTSASGTAASHTYAESGSYTVTLTVRDDRGGTHASSSVVEVLAENVPPTAEFTTTATGLRVAFDAAGSGDTDGTVAGYAWDFGDGTGADGVGAEHTYTEDGTYTVTLTTTDDRGGTASNQQTLVVANAAPSAVIAYSTNGLAAAFDAGESADPDGEIETLEWDFGDGTGGTGTTADHTYAAAGEYTVTLTVTDSRGASASTSVAVTVVTSVAAFEATVLGRGVSVDASASQGGSGDIVDYLWDFGDGGTATGPLATHRYASDGQFTVTLQVVDADGAAATSTRVLDVANLPPTADFSLETDALGIALDATTSTDADGTTMDYAWDFGDGSAGAGVTANHEYAEAGEYLVRLTVTDQDGGTATAERTAVLEGPPPGPATLAADAFSRTSTSGWGVADAGGSWTPAGSAANFTVADGNGRIRMQNPGSGPQIYVGGGLRELDLRARFGFDKAATGGGTYAYVLLRDLPGTGSYRAKIRYRSDGTVAAALERTVAGTTSALTPETVITGLRPAPGQQLSVRARITGAESSTLELQLWADGASEPATWQLSATDGTAALQADGRVGFGAYLSGSATNAPVHAVFDDLWIGQVAQP